MAELRELCSGEEKTIMAVPTMQLSALWEDIGKAFDISTSSLQVFQDGVALRCSSCTLEEAGISNGAMLEMILSAAVEEHTEIGRTWAGVEVFKNGRCAKAIDSSGGSCTKKEILEDSGVHRLRMVVSIQDTRDDYYVSVGLLVEDGVTYPYNRNKLGFGCGYVEGSFAWCNRAGSVWAGNKCGVYQGLEKDEFANACRIEAGTKVPAFNHGDTRMLELDTATCSMLFSNVSTGQSFTVFDVPIVGKKLWFGIGLYSAEVALLGK